MVVVQNFALLLVAFKKGKKIYILVDTLHFLCVFVESG
jgi:hypothetical protein